MLDNRYMKYRKQYSRYVLVALMVLVVIMSVGLPSAPAGSTKHRLAIVYTGRIKPYENLRDVIVEQFGDKLELKKFQINSTSDILNIENGLKNFEPAVIVAIGNMASEYCSSLNIAPVVLAYDTKLISRQNPFCVVKYLNPKAKKLVAIVDEEMAPSQREFLISLAGGYGLALEVKNAKPDIQDELLCDNDTVFLSQGILIINVNSEYKAPQGNCVIAVVDRSVESYKLLEKRCLSGLPNIEQVIDISELKGRDLRNILKKSNPSAIICVGSNSYKNCKFMQDSCRLSIVLKTKPVDADISRWGKLSGVNMFIDPEEQIVLLTELVKEKLKLAILYDPQNSEEVILKILLVPQDDIEFIALPVSNSNRVSDAITGAFSDYDGIWLIPDAVVSIAPIQNLLLEESLRREKILVTMMHPYTKAGALMSVSSVDENELDLCRRMAGLINERLDNPNCAGRVVSSPVYISINLRTAKNLKCEVSKSLLNRAEFVFGK